MFDVLKSVEFEHNDTYIENDVFKMGDVWKCDSYSSDELFIFKTKDNIYDVGNFTKLIEKCLTEEKEDIITYKLNNMQTCYDLGCIVDCKRISEVFD